MRSVRRCSKRAGVPALIPLLTLCLVALCACGQRQPPAVPSKAQTQEPAQAETAAPPQTEIETETLPDAGETEEPTLKLTINDIVLDVLWEDNESVAALTALAKDAPLTIQMSPYGGFEQVGPIGRELPRNDTQITTEPGDIVLYSGNQIVVFHGSNSWAYTPLGRIQGMEQSALTDLLGNGAVTVTLSVS